MNGGRTEIKDDVGAELFVQLERHRMRHNPLRDVLAGDDRGGERRNWCDDGETAERESCADIVARSLDDVVDELTRRCDGARLPAAGIGWLSRAWIEQWPPDPLELNLATSEGWQQLVETVRRLSNAHSI